MSSETFVLPEIVETVRFATHLVGKWHCGHAKPAYVPTSRGFDTFLGCSVVDFIMDAKSVMNTSSDLYSDAAVKF